MRVFNKELYLSVAPSNPDDSLIGFHYWKGVSECCSDEIDVFDIGFGLFKVTVTSQNC